MGKDQKHRREERKKAALSLKERRAKKHEKKERGKIEHRIEEFNVDSNPNWS